MNIFVFNLDPFLAAKDHPKSYLVKMPLETAQLLCTAHHVLNPNKYNIPYKKTHENHPCAVWVRQTKENYLWTINYGLGLCRWFTETRKKTHGCESIIDWAKHNVDKLQFKDTGLKSFALAMPDEYKCIDPVVSYQSYFKGEKKKLAIWEQGAPDWWGV
ncbi:MAG TPA: hypothetical protein PLP33_16435 [Leptospiraceae bacterium]|nr:hypothetical protein [Leptospiraceae bacterium]